MAFGLIVGASLWWSAYVPGDGFIQNLQILLVPVAGGMVAVSLRNRLKKVGDYDPETIAKNRRGRV